MKTTFKKLGSILLCLAIVFASLPIITVSAANQTIALDEEVTVTLDSTNPYAIFDFTPAEDGVYSFYAFNSAYDNYGHILDADGNELAFDDDSGESHNFFVSYVMKAGTTYQLKARFYSSEYSGSMIIKVEKATLASEISIKYHETYTDRAGGINSFYYTLLPDNTIATDIKWSSDDPSIVSMDKDGYAKMVNPGTTTIRVTTGEGLVDTCEVTVLAATEAELGKVYTATYDGTYYTESYRFTPEEDGWYVFSSSDCKNTFPYAQIIDASSMTLLEVDENPFDDWFYLQYKLIAGTTYYFTATTCDFNGSFNVQINKAEPATGMALNYPTISAYKGNSYGLRPVYTPVNASNEDITWESSDESVATVDSDGVVTCHSLGKATITATSENGLTATSEITVIDYPSIHTCQKVIANITHYSCHDGFYFTPEADGRYAFYSTGDIDTYGYVYSADGETFLWDNDDYHGSNFRVECEMTAGTTYLLRAEYYNDFLTGSFNVYLALLDDNGMEVHNYGDYVITDKEHSQTCLDCGLTITEEHSHNGQEPCICGKPHIHFVDNLSYSENTHHGYCDCGEYIEEPHSFDESGVCICNYYKHNHAIDNYFRDYESHWGECTSCYLNINEEHVFDEDGNCVCGYFYHEHTGSFSYNDDYHWGGCTVCLMHVEEDHVFDENRKCKCGYFEHTHEGSFSYDAYTHWGNCTICDMYVDVDHVFDENNNCICGYFKHEHDGIIEAYDSYYHWFNCTVCGKFVEIEHSFDEDGNCVCGYFEHICDTNDYGYDAKYHWGVCSKCGLDQGYGQFEHEYDENGICLVCDRELLRGAYVGNTLIKDGEYLDIDGNVTTEKPDGGYAHYSDGVLTLNNFVYSGEGPSDIDADTTLYAECDTVLVLEGKNSIHCTYGDGINLQNADLTIRGDGILSIKADGDYDGIDVDGGNLDIESGVLIIDASDHGIETYGDLTVNDGTIFIIADDDGFDINGDAEFNGGIIDIFAEDNGIDSHYDLTINGGIFNIFTDDDNGIEASYNVTVNGGEFNIDANDECFNAEDTLTVNGGAFDLDAGSGDAVMMAAYGLVLGEALSHLATAVDENSDCYVLVDENGEMIEDISILPENIEMIKPEWITLSAAKAPYTGKDHTPTVRVANGDIVLVAGEDYTIKWSEETIKGIGVYVVTVKGIGKYVGAVTKAYTIYEDVVYVGGLKLENGYYLASGATEVTDEAPADCGYAYYNNGVLTLNNFVYEGDDYTYDSLLESSSVVYSENDLKVILVGDNKLTTPYSGIVLNGGDLVIDGNGSLTIEGESGIGNSDGNITVNRGTLNIFAEIDGIWSYDNVTINGGKLNITAGSCGIYAEYALDIYRGTITITDAEEGMAQYYDSYGMFSYYDDISIYGGIITIDMQIGIHNYEYDVYICGGKLDITAEYGIACNYGYVEIDDGYVNIVSEETGIYAYYGLSITGGTLDIQSLARAFEFNEGVIYLSEYVTVSIPEGGVISEDGGSIVDADGNVAMNVKFEGPTTDYSDVYGDVDGDGLVTGIDAIALSTLVKNDVFYIYADLNFDGKITATDIMILMQIIKGSYEI